FLLAHHEVAEPGELDLLASLQRVLESVENHLDDLGGFLLGEPDFGAHAVDDVCPGHGLKSTRASPTRSNPKGKGARAAVPTQCVNTHLPKSREAGPAVPS